MKRSNYKSRLATIAESPNGDRSSSIGSLSGGRGSSVSKYDSYPTRSTFSATHDSGLRSYGSNRTINDNYTAGSSSMNRYGSSSIYDSSSRPPRPTSTTMDRYSSSGNLGSGVPSGSYRSSLEYSAPTRSYSYASGLSGVGSGSGYSSSYTGTSNYRSPSYTGYSSGLVSSRDYGSSRGLSKKDDYSSSYGSSNRTYSTANDAHSDITLRSAYAPKRYGSYEPSSRDKNPYFGVLKSEREMVKSCTPEIEHAFTPRDNDRSRNPSTLQLPDTTDSEFNTLYDRYVTHSPIKMLEEAAPLSSRRQSDSVISDSAYSSKKGQESETISNTSDKNDEEEFEVQEQDDETEQEESVTICCAPREEAKPDEKSPIEASSSSVNDVKTIDVTEQGSNEDEAVDEVEYSAESDNESKETDTKRKVQKEQDDQDKEIGASEEKDEICISPVNEDPVPVTVYSRNPWDDFNSSFADDEGDYKNDVRPKDGKSEPARNPWDDFASSFADEDGDYKEKDNKADEEEEEVEKEGLKNDVEKSIAQKALESSTTSGRNPWDDFASSFAEDDGDYDEEVEKLVAKVQSKNKLQKNQEISASNTSLWSDFDNTEAIYERSKSGKQNEDEEEAEVEEEEIEEVEGENKRRKSADDVVEIQCIKYTPYKPAAWEQFCSFDCTTDNEAEEDEEEPEGNGTTWQQFSSDGKPKRKFSIQIEADSGSESDASNRSNKNRNNTIRLKTTSQPQGMRFLVPPKKSAYIDVTSASDVESEFEFNPNSVSATFPFLPSANKHEERGRVEAHLALPAPIFNIQVSYDSDFPDEESVGSVSDYEDFSEGGDEAEQMSEEEVDVDDDYEYEDEIGDNDAGMNRRSEEQRRSESKVVPQIMVTSTDMSEMMASDYQDHLSQDGANDGGYDADVSRPVSMYASGDNFTFQNQDNEDGNTVETVIFIKKPSALEVRGRSSSPDSDTAHSQASSADHDKSVYHDAIERKRLEQEEKESEVFCDDTDEEADVVSHRSDLFIDAPTSADVIEVHIEGEVADEHEEEAQPLESAQESATHDETAFVSKKVPEMKLASAKLENELTPTEKAERIFNATKKPDSISALSRTVKGVNEKAKLQQTQTYVAPAKSEGDFNESYDEVIQLEEQVPSLKPHSMPESTRDIKVVPTLVKPQEEKLEMDRASSYQVKKPQESFAKKSVIQETKKENVAVKTVDVRVLDKAAEAKKEDEQIKRNYHLVDTQKEKNKSDVQSLSKSEEKTSESNSIKESTRSTTDETSKTNQSITPAPKSTSATESRPTDAKVKPRTSGVEKMSEKFEPKVAQTTPTTFDKYDKKTTSNATDSNRKAEEVKYPKAFNQQSVVAPPVPVAMSFEEQMEELRRKMKAGSNQFSQQMKDFRKGISDVATNAKLTTVQETHKNVLTDATNVRDQVTKKMDKFKESAEAEEARREKEIQEAAEKQAQKAKLASAALFTAAAPLSPSPIRKESQIAQTVYAEDAKLQTAQSKIEQAKGQDAPKVQKTLRGREPSKLSSPFMQKEKEVSSSSGVFGIDDKKKSPSNSICIDVNAQEAKSTSASPRSLKDDNKQASPHVTAQKQQVAPVPKQVANLAQRLGPDGESDHETKISPRFVGAPSKLGSQKVEEKSSVTGKIKEEAVKQTAELTKSKYAKADMVEPGVASQAKIKGSLHQAELAPSKVHGADEVEIVDKSPRKQTDATKKPSTNRGRMHSCQKCKSRKNKFIGAVNDIDELLSNKENRTQMKSFDQFEMFYQNCSRDKRTIEGAKSGNAKPKEQSKIFIWDITDSDELYDSKDLRTLMGLLSPTSKVTFDFFKNVDTTKPRTRTKVDDSALQVYKSYENGQGDFGSYLDPDLSLLEQPDELAVLRDGKRTSLVLRTQISVRVHTIIEKLLNSTGRELRRALFSLKQIFQDDKDLVHEFVQNDGLSCLIKVGAEADQNYQNYILRALGQVMLYVDGMNGVISHNETIQWLYSLLSSQFRLVVKTALKLLLVFVEYTESNSLLLLAAVYIVDKDRDSTPWSYLMQILNDKDNVDLELLVYTMTLINKTLNGIPDQDTYYDVVDALEERGMEETLKKMLKMNNRELTEQCRLYEAMMNQEDGDADENHNSTISSIAKMRQTPRTRTGSGDRKSHRKQFGSDEKRRMESSNGPASPDYSTKAKRLDPVPQRKLPKEETPGAEPVSKPGYRKYNDTHSTPGLPQSKRLTMDLLYKKSSPDKEDSVSAETEAFEKKLEQNRTKCPPPMLPDLTDEGPESNGVAPSTPPPSSKSYVGAVHSLADKYTTQPAAPKAPEPQAAPDDDDDGQNNTFAAALSKARKGMDKKIVSQAPVDSRKESDIQWEKAMENLNRPLIINDLDFTELEDMDDSDPLRQQPKNLQRGYDAEGQGAPPPPPPFGGAPPPPRMMGGIPPPPMLGGGPPPPPPGSGMRSPNPAVSPSPKDDMRTVKLFWKEAQTQPPAVLETKGVFWQKVKAVEIDTEKVVHLFETKASKEVVAKKKEDKKPEIRVLDTKRSNAINIGLTKLPPPRAIKTAIMKFDSTIMSKEGIEKILSTMMPTEEEKEKIMETQAAQPDVPLGAAEQFLMLLSEIPALLPRLRLWLFMLDYANLEKEVAEPLMDLKLAMEELDQSRTFQYVMGTLLAVGNVLNGAEIKGFQLDFLAKVPEVKDTVHKHSLVYHLCTIVQEKFPDSTDLYSELGAVVRSARVDFEEVLTNLEKMEKDCKASWDYLRVLAKHETSHSLKSKIGEFLSDCAQRIMTLKIIHRRVINRFRKFLLYMGIPPHAVKDTKMNSTCKTISEFALEYRTSCDKINQQKKRMTEKRERNKTRGKMITDNVKLAGAENGAPRLHHDEQRHDELSKVLQQTTQDDDGSPSWKSYPGAKLRHRRNPSPSNAPASAAAEGQDSPDDEILDGLVKAATVKTVHPREERRKARQFNRKSLRRTRTLKLVQDQTSGDT